MQRDRQLDRAQAGGEMAAAGADGLDQELAQLRGQGRQLLLGQRRRSAGVSMPPAAGIRELRHREQSTRPAPVAATGVEHRLG